MPTKPQLGVVLPVYNEAASIRRVIDEWYRELERTVGDFVILAINDGSKDATPEILGELRDEFGERLEVISRENRGHGQTCMQGYRIAAERGIPYILQIDSDGQSNPAHLAAFWERRGEFDVIYGKRKRFDGSMRIFASATLKALLLLLQGVDCTDANVPYRLMDTKACKHEFKRIPPEISLANIALAVILRRNPSIRHGKVPITFPARYGGEPSVPLRLFAAKGLRLFLQLSKLSAS